MIVLFTVRIVLTTLLVVLPTLLIAPLTLATVLPTLLTGLPTLLTGLPILLPVLPTLLTVLPALLTVLLTLVTVLRQYPLYIMTSQKLQTQHYTFIQCANSAHWYLKKSVTEIRAITKEVRRDPHYALVFKKIGHWNYVHTIVFFFI